VRKPVKTRAKTLSRITNQPLYQLSYAGVAAAHIYRARRCKQVVDLPFFSPPGFIPDIFLSL
jgi:hypothetical protein